MMLIMKKQDMQSNNLANANTTGFKQSRLLTRTEIDIDRNDEWKLHQDEFQRISERHVSHQQGPLIQTGNPLDLAISGEGFFLVETPRGNLYTRGGSFTQDSEGRIVTLQGYPLLTDKGAYIKALNERVSFEGDGTIWIEGVKSGRLSLNAFDDMRQIHPAGDNLFVNLDPVENFPRKPREMELRAGYLEGSNVNTIDSMVRMIAEYRNYESNQKSIHAIDDTIRKAVNEVGRVG